MRLLLLPFLLGACTLIDQNTFNAHAGDKPDIPLAPKMAATPPTPRPPPLVVIGTTDPAAYAETLRTAVASARARKPDVTFDVVEIQSPETQGDTPIGTNAASVARIIVAQGIPPTRVRLVARPEANAPPQQVRVYVR